MCEEQECSNNHRVYEKNLETRLRGHERLERISCRIKIIGDMLFVHTQKDGRIEVNYGDFNFIINNTKYAETKDNITKKFYQRI